MGGGVRLSSLGCMKLKDEEKGEIYYTFSGVGKSQYVQAMYH